MLQSQFLTQIHVVKFEYRMCINIIKCDRRPGYKYDLYNFAEKFNLTDPCYLYLTGAHVVHPGIMLFTVMHCKHRAYISPL